MNILLINHYAGSPHHGMEFRPFYLSREWVAAGHSVQIAAASYSHIRAKQPLCNGEILDQQIEGVNYRWYPTPPFSGNGFNRVRNMLSFVRAIWRDAPRIAKQFAPDVVIASSTYPMDIWPARRIARLAGATLVFEVHDLWPLSPIELGGMSKWHPFIVWVQYAEDFAYRHADIVVSMLPKAKEHMCSRGMHPGKFNHVPNGVDVSDWERPELMPPEVAAPLAEVKAKGLPVVGYAGTFGLANALDVLLDAASLLNGQAEIVLVGKGPERESLEKRVARENLSNVRILPAIPKRAVPSLLSQVDIAYIGWNHNPLYRFGISPNKLMDYMMAAIPIVHSVSAGNDPVAEAGCGVTVAPRDAAAVANAIIEMSLIPKDQRQRIGMAGRAFVLKKHTYRVLAQKFLLCVSARHANGTSVQLRKSPETASVARPVDE